MTEGLPTVDVVIPVRNRRLFIAGCLDSVRRQSLQPRSIIVVDDGSTDDTRAIVGRYCRDWPALRMIPTAPRGVSAARNLGLAEADAELVALIDSDDLWEPDRLARQVPLFASGEANLGLVYCGLRRIDGDGRALPLPDILPSKRGNIFRDLLEGFCGIAPSTMLLRRQVALGVGGFDESLVHAEDRDFCLKLARISDFDFVPEALVRYRLHKSGSYLSAMAKQPDLVLFERLSVWNRWSAEIRDWDAVLDRFRSEATAASLALLRPPHTDVSLYARLKHSDLELANRLFPDFWFYAMAMLGHAFRRKRRGWLGVFKTILAHRVILPCAPLLRLARALGYFQKLSDPRDGAVP